jgi:hypothetical protein
VPAKSFSDRGKVRLADIRSIRAEMCAVYRACVRGEVPWPQGRIASLILVGIANLDANYHFEERLNAIEARLAEHAGRPIKPNGGAPERAGRLP